MSEVIDDVLPLTNPTVSACASDRDRTDFQSLKAALLAFTFPAGYRDDDPMTPGLVRTRRRLAGEIDRLHAAGAPWPCFDPEIICTRSGRPRPFTPSACGVERRRSTRPENGYCVRWNGAFWVPCMTQKERRAAGYVALTMAWDRPRLNAGAVLVSGMHARSAYLIREIEWFDAPSGARRYTCRLWCDRVDPNGLNETAVVHQFRWFPRKRRPQMTARRK